MEWFWLSLPRNPADSSPPKGTLLFPGHAWPTLYGHHTSSIPTLPSKQPISSMSSQYILPHSIPTCLTSFLRKSVVLIRTLSLCGIFQITKSVFYLCHRRDIFCVLTEYPGGEEMWDAHPFLTKVHLHLQDLVQVKSPSRIFFPASPSKSSLHSS